MKLEEAMNTVSTDNMRFCIANAGHAIEDANFIESDEKIKSFIF